MCTNRAPPQAIDVEALVQRAKRAVIDSQAAIAESRAAIESTRAALAQLHWVRLQLIARETPSRFDNGEGRTLAPTPLLTERNEQPLDHDCPPLSFLSQLVSR